jgi:hypothetical protein
MLCSHPRQHLQLLLPCCVIVSAALVLLSLFHLPLILSASGHNPGEAPAVVAPHPHVYLIELVAAALVLLCVSQGAYKMLLTLEEVWIIGLLLMNTEWKEGGEGQHICHRADVKAGQVLIAGWVMEHGHSRPQHDSDTVWSQIGGLNCAEVYLGHLLVRSTVP